MSVRRTAAVLLLTVLVTIGCRGGMNDNLLQTNEGHSPETAAGSSLAGQLRVLTNRVDLIENGTMQRYVDEFEAIHSESEIEVEGLTNYASDIRVMLSTHDAGDVLLIPGNMTGADLAAYFEPLDKRMLKGMRFSNFASYEGHTYGMTTGVSTEGIVYNKQAFAKAGVTEIPRTLTQFMAVSAKLKKAGIIPLAMNYGAQWPLSQWGDHLIRMMTGDVHYLNKMVDEDRPWQPDSPWGDAVRIAQSMIDQGYVEQDLLKNHWEGFKQEIAAGRIAMTLIGNWYISQLIDVGADSEQIGFFPFPYDDESDQHHALQTPDWFIGISKYSNNKRLAKAWIDFFVKQSGYVNDSGFMPVMVDGTTEVPQLIEFESYQPIWLNNVPANDSLLNRAKRSGVLFWSADIVQELIAADPLTTVMERLNDKWQAAGSDNGYISTSD